MMHSVLVVDDEAQIRELLGRWLEAGGYEVREADTAERALEIMAERAAVVVMCDIEMPGNGGIWLADQVRQLYPVSAMVLATGLDTVPPVISMKSGIVEYLVKPLERNRVFDAVAAGVAWHTAAAKRLLHPEAERGSIASWLDSSIEPE
jgi:DNA-binding NtrC family response regulator